MLDKGWVISVFRSREELLLENLALRQQLLPLRAKPPGHWENRVFNPIPDCPITAEAACDSGGLESTVRLCHDRNCAIGPSVDGSWVWQLQTNRARLSSAILRVGMKLETEPVVVGAVVKVE
jgi:hypothetical protein